MMKIYHIMLDEMQLGTNIYNCGDIMIENWDKKSLCLNDYVRFRILLSCPLKKYMPARHFSNRVSR